MTAASRHHIVCPHCGAVNSVPTQRSARAANCGKCQGRLFEGHVVPVTEAEFQRHILRNDIPVVVDFWAEWCGPCKAMAPIYAKVAAEEEPQLRFLKVDTEAEPGLAARYGIRGIPTMMLFKHGKPAAQQVGAVGEQAMRAWIRGNLD